jgi:hypothetical protein
MPPTAGYSTTPLAKKLGIKENFLLRLVNQPETYRQFFTDWPDGIVISSNPEVKKDLIHFFATCTDDLYQQLPLLKDEIKEYGAIWVSWPKKASKVATDITEDVIRDLALRIGLVDVKVCAVDATWSGLKLVIPVAKRKKT